MKIQSINYNYVLYSNRQIFVEKEECRQKCSSLGISNLYYHPNINFGIANSAKLKVLFSYGLPCMYSGVEMIDPKKVQKLLKQNAFDAPIKDVMAKLSKFESSITDKERSVYCILQNASKQYPDYSVQQALEAISPRYLKFLRKMQAPIFAEIKELGNQLPKNYKPDFERLMSDTDNKLNDRPVLVPFSSYEFKYKLAKIQDDVAKNKSPKSDKVMNKLVDVSEYLTGETTTETIENQKNVISFLKIILKSSILKGNESLRKLFNDSQKRLNGETLLVPFSRKTFLYDLHKLLDDLPNKELREKIFTLGGRLPSSSTSVSACVLKYAGEPSWKAAYRILWPNMASVEHIVPQSCGGADDMSNFGGAGAKENALRGNIDFVEQISRRPETPKNCQKYVDRLIDLAAQGVFKSNNINTQYIKDFKNTIQIQSQNRIMLDISKLDEIVV